MLVFFLSESCLGKRKKRRQRSSSRREKEEVWVGRRRKKEGEIWKESGVRLVGTTLSNRALKKRKKKGRLPGGWKNRMKF